jgi:hypothetical protein
MWQRRPRHAIRLLLPFKALSSAGWKSAFRTGRTMIAVPEAGRAVMEASRQPDSFDPAQERRKCG